jgi:3-oxoacyl-(acyl-carrier-protein) synthase
MEIYITGCGITSSLGTGCDTNWAAINNQTSGISRENHFADQEEKFNIATVKNYVGNDRLYDITKDTFKECILDASLSKEDLQKTALVYAHGSPSNDVISTEIARLRKTGRSKPNTVYRCMNSFFTSKLATEFGITETVISNSAACSGSAQAIHIGLCLLKSGLVDRCICGGGDVIDYFTYTAFQSMKIILAPNSIVGKEAMRPFGADRKGIVLGEGVGFLVLENTKSLVKRGVTPYAQLVNSSYENAPDAVYGNIDNITTWNNIINKTIDNQHIDYVITHGTSTIKGDCVEAQAISNTLPNAYASALKCFFGHTLSASSVLDIAMLMYSFKNNTMLGSGTHYKIDDKLTSLQLLQKNQQYKFNRAIKLSAGFGGGLSCIYFQRA